MTVTREEIQELVAQRDAAHREYLRLRDARNETRHRATGSTKRHRVVCREADALYAEAGRLRLESIKIRAESLDEHREVLSERDNDDAACHEAWVAYRELDHQVEPAINEMKFAR